MKIGRGGYGVKSLLLDAFIKLEQDKEFLRYFSKFKGNSRFDFTLDTYYLRAAKILEEKGDFKTMFKYLERLAAFIRFRPFQESF